MHRIAVIGAGVVGSMIARQLEKYEKSIVILERENDVAMGQSKANSGIVHAGFDPEPGSLKAVLNVKGSEMMEQVCRELSVKYRKNGTLVAGFSQEDMKTLEKLLERGRINGVRDLEIIDGERVRSLEPALSGNIKGALYAPTGAIVCPYELTIHAAGNAMDNGAELMLNFNVKSISREDGRYIIKAEDGRTVEAEYVINCAGLYSDEIAGMVGDERFRIKPRRGEYFLLDKEAGGMVSSTVFRTPDEMGKGVLATSTVDGNVLLGPTSEDQEDKEDRSTTREGLDYVRKREMEFFDVIPWDRVITQFTGLRAHGNLGDFIIDVPEEAFINCAGIESPGLSSAPAIAEMVEGMMLDMGMNPVPREDYDPEYGEVFRFALATDEERSAAITKNPSYGRIVCRCEKVSEGEILDAIRRNPGAKDVDGVKRRTRAGMGRCQSGFCMPLTADILAKELGVSFDEITKRGGLSYFSYGNVENDEE